MNWEYFKEVWQQHCGKITGAFFGVLMAIMIILFGFFNTLFIELAVKPRPSGQGGHQRNQLRETCE